MAKIIYPESPLERDHLRDALRRRGKNGVDEIAEAIQRRWHHSTLRSYRLAVEMSLEEVCAQVNRLLGVFAGETGYFDRSTLSRLEWWPTKSRRPTVSHLVTLAQVYGTSPRKLIAEVDLAKFPPADQFALQTLDSQTRAGATEPAPAVGMMEAVRPQAGPDHRPHTQWALSDPTRSGDPSERLITMTGDETAQYGDRGSSIGDTMLDQLRADTVEMAGKFANLDRTQHFSSLRLLRDRLFYHLDMPGRSGVSQNRDLHFLAGATCGMLAIATNSLGFPNAAMSHMRVAHMFAQESGDTSLDAWVFAEQAAICYWNGQPGRAHEYARRGQDLHPVGTVAVALPAVEARAAGELGDAEKVHAAIRRAADARDRVLTGPLDDFGGIMSFGQAKQHFYAVGAYLGLGDNTATIAEADAAVTAYENGPEEDKHFPNRAIARFCAAVSHVRSGDLDAAQHSAQTALGMAPEHHDAVTDKSAKRLHRQLCASRVRSAPLAIEIRDQIEGFLSATPARLELS